MALTGFQEKERFSGSYAGYRMAMGGLDRGRRCQGAMTPDSISSGCRRSALRGKLLSHFYSRSRSQSRALGPVWALLGPYIV